MNIYEETRMIMTKYGLNTKKKLGQNFLVSEDILESIVTMADISLDDTVIEIGPGIGTLTQKLLEKAKKVISVEIDDELIEPLKARFFMYDNFHLIHEDFLKIDMKDLKDKLSIEGKVKVVANIPYYITTPIISKLIDFKEYISKIYVMVQKEVAEKMTADLGTRDSSALSYYISYNLEAFDTMFVSKENFLPPPKVDSMVLALKVREERYPDLTSEEESLYFKLIAAGFKYRRKTLINGIKLSGGFDLNRIKEIFSKLDIDERIRPERLTAEDYSSIVKEYLDN